MKRAAVQRVLITGIHGSGASYLAEHIAGVRPEVEIHGLARWHSSRRPQATPTRVVVHECDLNDFPSLLAALRDSRPQAIFHLAAHANVRASFVEPNAVLSNNILGTSNLLEAVRAADLDPVIQICSTSEVYGQVDPKDVPITEDTPMRPVSPYAVSKAAQDMLGFSYYKSYGMKIFRTRMFTYLNPRRTDLFATSFAKQIAWIERGLQKELVHGNLESVRTFIDVRDGMRAYWEAVGKCQPGEAYNIGGETTLTVGECLERLKKLTTAPIKSRPDPSLMRPADVTLQVPCIEKFREATGWRPRYGFDESLALLIEHWRKEADREVWERSHG